MKIDPTKKYTARQAARFFGLTEATMKRHLREDKTQSLGVQIGPRKRWYMSGKGILKLRKAWKLDALSD
jgi:predicted transcriptional regulator